MRPWRASSCPSSWAVSVEGYCGSVVPSVAGRSISQRGVEGSRGSATAALGLARKKAGSGGQLTPQMRRSGWWLKARRFGHSKQLAPEMKQCFSGCSLRVARPLRSWCPGSAQLRHGQLVLPLSSDRCHGAALFRARRFPGAVKGTRSATNGTTGKSSECQPRYCR